MPSAVESRERAARRDAGWLRRRMRALVTGGAGFIGHHLVRTLHERGHAVRVLDDLSTGVLTRLPPPSSGLAFIEGSILDRDALDRAIATVDVVFHLAAVASVARSIAAPRHTDEVNVGGTIEVMLAAARHGVRKVVFAGSSAVYGVPATLPCTEQHLPAPQSPYGASKLAAEHYVHSLGTIHGVETMVFRYFNVFGPGQDPASEYAAVIPRFVTSVLAGDRPTIFGSGDISRDFVYVDDVVDANLLASTSGSATGLTCNIGSGVQRTLLELLEAVNAAAGTIVEPLYGPARPGDIRDSVGDITLARDAIGYEAKVPFPDAIHRTVDWYRRQRPR